LRARSYLSGLLNALERKNGWSLAGFASGRTPDGMQRLLDRARWDAGLVRDALRRQVAERMGSLAEVPVVDDTGFKKKGPRSALRGRSRAVSACVTTPSIDLAGGSDPRR
jgi:SRSO17 transposase